MLLNASHLHKTYGEKVLLDDEALTIEERDKIALIGVNGTGKSTLLKILAGLDDPADIITKKGLTIHFMSQQPLFHEGTIWEEAKYINAKNQMPRADYELTSILHKMELDQTDLAVDQLSGGQKRRLSLALALISDAQLLFLDEPTNHLDNDMIAWLEKELIKTTRTVFMITHDRYFLERVCTRIIELDHGKLYEHKGSYSDYLQARAERMELESANQAKLENLYRKELAWVRAGVQARSTKSKARLDRFEELRKARKQIQEQNLDLNLSVSRLGKKTIEWKDLSFGYGDKPLFSNFTYQLKRNDRIGLVGPNGCGKTTFLKLIMGQLQPDAGTIEMGSTVRLGYYLQDYAFEDLSVKVIDFLEKDTKQIHTDKGTISASAMLERFMFDKGLHHLPIERLSGGERRRLYLLKVLIEQPNVLILDEPTNDLDLITLEILEDYLDDFAGIVITVSHDRYFLDRICDYLFVWQEDGSWKQVIGGYSELVLDRQNQKSNSTGPSKTGASGTTTPPQKTWKKPNNFSLNYKEKRRLEQLPGLIEAKEEEIASIDTQMGKTTAFKEIESLSAKRQEAEALLEEMEMEYLELLEKQESLAG